MILGDFLKAVAQLPDPRFRRVVWLGVLLALVLLFAIYGVFLWFLERISPAAVTLPLVGEVEGVGALLSLGSIVFMIGLSVFLMVPVAAAFSGFFLEDVAAAVEARHYPGLPPAAPVPVWDTVVDGVNYFGLMVVVSLAALATFAVAPPLVPLILWGLNGLLLGREYFMLVAMRRLGRAGARALRARHPVRIWVAGVLMAMPLSVPLVNLVIPVLGAATFTHLFHRLAAAPAARSSRDR
ncbi:MAG: EI24 domain-containing protein [Rhodobacteraceae bacterium]|nr:EI24 domain-containing protein [Paracoccaceae bacterium]